MSIHDVCTMYEKGYSLEKIADKYARTFGIEFLDAMESVQIILNRAWR